MGCTFRLSDVVSPPLPSVRDGPKSEVMSLSTDNWGNPLLLTPLKF